MSIRNEKGKLEALCEGRHYEGELYKGQGNGIFAFPGLDFGLTSHPVACW